MRFTYEQMAKYLANGTDVARREGWPLSDCISMVNGVFCRNSVPVTLKPSDETASDWVVYRQA